MRSPNPTWPFTAGCLLSLLPATLVLAQLDDQQAGSHADLSRQDLRQQGPAGQDPRTADGMASSEQDLSRYRSRPEDTSRFDSRAFSSGASSQEAREPDSPE